MGLLGEQETFLGSITLLNPENTSMKFQHSEVSKNPD
ncbi:hypothetical protein TorRG33x02_029410 [Trema orientale]|uniref:Uncharacterized protein n=1 Tax=Trema orientale TaxID=63057 RepID=A0A2P5FTT8_TREOI|nr:hypothetical protein TorRG33x02_029410 [Trema orientale]